MACSQWPALSFFMSVDEKQKKFHRLKDGILVWRCKIGNARLCVLRSVFMDEPPSDLAIVGMLVGGQVRIVPQH
jgi:hypothetical protein